MTYPWASHERLNAADLNAAFDTVTSATATAQATANAAGSSSFVQAGTGAVSRTVTSKLRDAVNPVDFGAVADNAAFDNTAAFQAALNTGQSLEVGPGVWHFADGQLITMSTTGQQIVGCGRRGASGIGGTTLRFNGTGTAHCIVVGTASINAAGNRIANLEIRAPFRLGGAAVHARNTYRLALDTLWLTFVFNGYISTAAQATRISDVLILDVRGDYGVAALSTLAEGSDILELLHVTVAGHASIVNGAGGLRCTALYLDNVGSVLIHGFKALSGCGTGMKAVRTDAGLTAGGGFINAHLFACEYMVDVGVSLQAGHHWYFSNSYIFGTTAGPGIVVGANCTNVVFSAGDISSNFAGGAIVQGTSAAFLGCDIALNGPNPYTHDGIEIEATAKFVRVAGCQIGRRTNSTGGQRYGIRVDAGATAISIVGNDLVGNVLAAMLNNATAGEVKTRGNIGWTDSTDRISVDGTGDFRLGNANGDALRVTAAATIANRFTIAGSATGGAVAAFVEGTDTDIGLTVAAKGTGVGRLRHDTTDKLTWSSTGVGFNGTAPTAKPTVTGSKGANAALTSLLAALAALGLITDSST